MDWLQKNEPQMHGLQTDEPQTDWLQTNWPQTNWLQRNEPQTNGPHTDGLPMDGDHCWEAAGGSLESCMSIDIECEEEPMQSSQNKSISEDKKLPILKSNE